MPLVVLAVPFLDTGFVVAKRIKYRRPVYRGDSNHFHHRFHRIGFSQRRTVLYLYAWTLTMAGVAVALRFIPYSDDLGRSEPRLGAADGRLLRSRVAASVYLVCVLEILKLRRVRAWQLRRTDPDTTEHEIDERGRARARDRRVPPHGSNLKCAANRTCAPCPRRYFSRRPIDPGDCREEVSRTVMNGANFRCVALRRRACSRHAFVLLASN